MENEGEYSVHATHQAYSGDDSYLSTDDGSMVYAVSSMSEQLTAGNLTELNGLASTAYSHPLIIDDYVPGQLYYFGSNSPGEPIR